MQRLFLLMLIVVIAATASSAQTPSTANEFTDRALTRQLQGDLEGAIADYTEAIKLEPDNIFYYKQRAWLRYKNKNYDEAIADYTKAIELSPRSTTYASRGDARVGKNDYDGAIDDYNKAIELNSRLLAEINPKLVGAYHDRGIARVNKRDYDGAVADFTKVIELKPNDANSYDYRGNAKYIKKDFESAIADYTRAIGLDQNDAWAYAYRGVSNLILGKPDSAHNDGEKSLELTYSKGQTIMPYRIIVTYFGLRESNKTADGGAFLGIWGKRLNSPEWPAPVISYLLRQLTEPQLLALATDNRKMTDAHTYVGMEMALLGNRQAALSHFRWLRDNGDKSSFVYSLGESELRRLEATLPRKPQ